MKHWCLLTVFLSACASVPAGIKPVQEFSLEQYLGKWYEIARLDHPFERGLSHVSAEYILNQEGSIRVKNIGYSAADDRWQEAIGKAFLVQDENTAHLKVSFQWPFYSSYIVFKIDSAYRYAYVTGNSRDYLWLLARTPHVSEAILQDFFATASAAGFDTQKVILVNQPPLD